MKNIISALILASVTLSCNKAIEPVVLTEPKTQEQPHSKPKPKNIIMVIGDGMGPSYTTAYRYFKDDISTPHVENTVFDRTLVGMSSTYPDTQHNYVTDSAAAATALSGAIKTYNSAVAVNTNKEAVTTVLEHAKSLGKKTGVVVTSQINHATPASYLTHNKYRYNYNEIADSYIDGGIKADLYLGGGWAFFIRDDRNLVKEFKYKGFNYIDKYSQLNDISPAKPLLGLFADKGLPWAIDDSNKHRLLAMTKTATQHLQNKEGYFLLVEGSLIDWAGHANDIAASMAEMDDFAKTLEYLEEYVKTNPDTLVVVTADHSTGGLTLGANGEKQWQPEMLRTMTQSPNVIANKLETTEITQQIVNELFNTELTTHELSLLIKVKNNALTALKIATLTNRPNAKKINVNEAIYNAVKKIIDERTHTGWTTSYHTAIDVPVFAFGSNKELFNGYQDNTDIGKKMFDLLGELP